MIEFTKENIRPVTAENRVILHIEPIPQQEVDLGGTKIIIQKAAMGKVTYHASDIGLLEDRIHKLKHRESQLGTYQLVERQNIRKLLGELETQLAELEENEVLPEESFDVVEHNQNYGHVMAIPSELTKDSYGRDFDNQVQLEVGDEVWFHHNVMKDNFSLGFDNCYWCPYDMIYAYRRNGEIKTVGDWCLATIDKETEEDIRTQSGIWLKALPGAKYLQATLDIVGVPKRKQSYFKGLKQGDKVIYSPSSDIKIKIAGKTYYRFQFEDIMLVNGLHPVGEWVRIKPDDLQTHWSKTIVMAEGYRRKNFKGIVLEAGAGCKYVKEGDYVEFLASWNYEFEDSLIIPEDKILMRHD